VLLRVRLQPDGQGRTRALSPAVGVWSDGPADGQLVGAGGEVGVLRQLNQRFRLALPDGVEGRVEGAGSARQIAVEFGQVLFHLAAVSAAVAGDGAASADAAVPVTSSRSSQAGHAVPSPTHGVFYRRSAPDAPPFVELGSRIRKGEALGLIEVMKTFHQILFVGPGLPEEAEVVEICCQDAEEVTPGQALFRVR
jgi:acetyl-CoA carboxylase biotin carboxyl carrier protein